MKKIISFLIITLFLYIIFSYKLFIIEAAIVKKSDTPPQKLYINLFEPKVLTNTFYEYDQSLQQNTILLKKKIKDYTSFSYSKIHNKLYFVDQAEDGTMKLFVKEFNKNQIKQLTKGLDSVDLIQIDKKQITIFMRVLLKGEYRNFHIATYDTEKNQLEVWEIDNKDKNILDFDYNPNNNKLIAISFSEAEDKKKLEEANQKQIMMKPPKYSLDIYKIDGSKEKHVLILDKFISSATVENNENSVIFSYEENLISPISHVEKVNLNSNKIKSLFNSTKTHFKIRELKYDTRGAGFFFYPVFLIVRRSIVLWELQRKVYFLTLIWRKKK